LTRVLDPLGAVTLSGFTGQKVQSKARWGDVANLIQGVHAETISFSS
jgi:hypothetical protein